MATKVHNETRMLIKKRMIEDKENKARKKPANEKKTSSTLTQMYEDEEGMLPVLMNLTIDDGLEEIIPKKVIK